MATYRVRQKLVAIGDDFWIENDRGEPVYKVDGKALRLRNTLIFEDVDGNELCTIQERMLRIKDSMEIEDPGRRRLAMVKKALIAPLRPLCGQRRRRSDLKVQGNLLDYEYTIGRGAGQNCRVLEDVVPGGGHLRRADCALGRIRADPGRYGGTRLDGTPETGPYT